MAVMIVAMPASTISHGLKLSSAAAMRSSISACYHVSLAGQREDTLQQLRINLRVHGDEFGKFHAARLGRAARECNTVKCVSLGTKRERGEWLQPFALPALLRLEVFQMSLEHTTQVKAPQTAKPER